MKPIGVRCRIPFVVLLGIAVVGLSSCAGGVSLPEIPFVSKSSASSTASSANPSVPTGPKRRVAVLPFAVKTVEYSWPDAGGTGSEMLTTELFKSGSFIVVERELLDKVMKEQSLSLSGAINPNTIVELGKVLGVQIIILGSVTQLGFSKQNTNVMGVAVGSLTAEAAIDVRAIDTSTAQLLLADTGIGKVAAQSIAVKGQGQEVTDQNTRLMGDALRKAAADITPKLLGQIEKSPWAGRVVKVTGSDIYVNGGIDMGLKPGILLDVYRPGSPVIDPVTRQILGVQKMLLGQVRVTNVEARYAVATVGNGTGFRENDILQIASEK